MTAATMEKGPTGVDLYWPKTTANKESRWKMAQWAAIAGAAMIGVDPVVNSFVLPTASQALGMDSGTRALASSIATLILTAGLLGAGALGDRIGRRRVLVIGTWITVVGELVSTFAVGSGQFILGRAIVGVGMAGLFGMAIGMIPAVTKPDQLPKVYGRMFACTAVGGLVAILGSGVLVSLGGWRLGFSLNVICAIGVALFAMYAIPENQAAEKRDFDYKGVILAAAALLLFMYGLGETGAKGWGDPTVLICIFGGLALGVVFILVEKRERHPSFPLQVFKVPAVVAATVALVAAGIAQGSAQANLTELMQTAGGYSASTVSIIALPMVIFGVIGALLTGSMVAKGTSVRLVLALTVALMAVGILLLVFISPALALVIAPLSLGLIGFGQQGSYGTGATVIMRTAPSDMLGSVGTIKPVMGQLGYGLGLGAIVPLITNFTRTAEENGSSSQAAAFHGFNMGMLIVFIIEVIALVAVWVVLRARKTADGAPDPMLPPEDDAPGRHAAVLEAEAQSEIP